VAELELLEEALRGGEGDGDIDDADGDIDDADGDIDDADVELTEADCSFWSSFSASRWFKLAAMELVPGSAQTEGATTFVGAEASGATEGVIFRRRFGLLCCAPLTVSSVVSLELLLVAVAVEFVASAAESESRRMEIATVSPLRTVAPDLTFQLWMT
jgi:hypothetical protein